MHLLKSKVISRKKECFVNLHSDQTSVFDLIFFSYWLIFNIADPQTKITYKMGGVCKKKGNVNTSIEHVH